MTVSVGIYLVDDRDMKINSMLNRARTTQKHLKGQSSQSQYAIYSSKQRDDIMMQKTIENGFEDAIKTKNLRFISNLNSILTQTNSTVQRHLYVAKA